MLNCKKIKNEREVNPKMAKYVFGKPCASKIKLKKSMLSRLSALNVVDKDSQGYSYLDIKDAPFVLGGLVDPKDNCGEYYRLDASKKEVYSDANRGLAECTAGGSVRFSTDADKIFVRVYLRGACVGMHHFCDRGVFGIDAYVGTGTKRAYVGAAMQTFADSPEFNSGELLLPKGVNEVQINLPLYGGITKMEIGFPKNSRVGAPTPRSVGAIAFYGSSVTQGGCVSRPANSYANVLCRVLDADCCNYGFSGSGMGELCVAEHIASRNLACFVMDYDYNAPSHEHLKATHEPFFKLIREKNPNLPVVFVTHPFFEPKKEFDVRRIEIIRETYENAVNAGDKNVYFVDSTAFFPDELRDLYSVDNLHPNDLGQIKMAEVLYPVVKKAIAL